MNNLSSHYVKVKCFKFHNSKPILDAHLTYQFELYLHRWGGVIILWDFFKIQLPYYFLKVFF